MTETSKKTISELVICICYPVWFWKDPNNVKTLIDAGSEVNVIHLVFILNLRLCVTKTDVETQKIDEFHWDIFGMIKTCLFVKDKLGKVWVFWEIFLLTNTSINMIFEMFFFILSKVDVQFIWNETCLGNSQSWRALANNKGCGNH